MKDYIPFAIVAFLFVLIGCFIGWNLRPVPVVTERTIMVPVEVNMDSLESIILAGKVDSIELTAKEREILQLEGIIHSQAQELAGNLIHPIPVTPSEASAKLYGYTAKLDTPVTVKYTVIKENDTTTSEVSTRIKETINFLPGPNSFRVTGLTVDPFTIWVPSEEKVTTIKEPTNLGLMGLMGWSGKNTPSVGGMLRMGWLSVGMMGTYKREPTYLIGVQIGKEL